MRDNGKTLDLSGRKFGRLIVESRADDGYSSTGRRKINWNCVCDCGSHCVKSSRNLLSDHISSCGCLKSELLTERNKRSGTHGQSRSRLYSVWGGMLGRCRNTNNQAYDQYGARHIDVCKEWETFEPFKAWAVSHGYNDTLTIDRIDNNKGYFPENCRWVDMRVQSNNRRSNVLLEYAGQQHTIAEWSRICGIHPDTIGYRLKHGWSVEDAITQIPKGQHI